MVYVDPAKLAAYQMSPMDVVRAVNNANLILPSGDVKIGPFDYTLFTNSQFRSVPDINRIPVKTAAGSMVLVGDIGHAEDANQIQNNIVQVDGQPSAYLPVMKQGGDTNTIAVVNGVKNVVSRLLDVPAQLKADVVFDQSLFVKRAIETLLDEGGIGLVLTGLMVLVFLGSGRATAGVFLSIPLSVLCAIIMLYAGGSSINTMLLAGFALVFSRLIDNAVIVLENIFRHLEMGESPAVAAEKGGEEVSLAVLAATLTSSVVFFPVTFFVRCQQVPVFGTGRSRSAGAGRIVLRRDDRGAAVLREVSEGPEPRGPGPGGDWSGAAWGPGAVQSRLRGALRTAARLVRRACAARAAPASPSAGHGGSGLRCQSRPVPLPGRRLLPSNGCWPIRHELESAVRQPNRSDRRRSAQGRGARAT